MNTRIWVFFVWFAFIVSVLSAGIVINTLNVEWTIKALLSLICLFLVFSSISLAKTVRDVEEEKKIKNAST